MVALILIANHKLILVIKFKKQTTQKDLIFLHNCNGMNYGESSEHLNTKIQIHQNIVDKQLYFIKKNNETIIERFAIEV